MNQRQKPYITSPDNAERIAKWLRTRNGIAIWQAIDFSRAAQTLTTPATTTEGNPFPKPTNWVAATPACIITDFADVLISKDETQVPLLEYLTAMKA